MPATLPDGDPVPDDGSLPPIATQGFGNTPFGVYVHVPFCQTRCGYCDFNTYTATELGGGGSQAAYPGLVGAELELAARTLPAGRARVSTVFFGGGTPTLLRPAEIAGMIGRIDDVFGLDDDAEVTIKPGETTTLNINYEAAKFGG